uniref:Uncharacterized protein n=1 Tax=Moniliophthora roreri TaxID=221103 RepID=A0A0W0FIC9_MONRR
MGPFARLNSKVAKLMVHVYSTACIATQLNLTHDH